jgi:uncharacterized membrane protein YbhN (UPF0104 family)
MKLKGRGWLILLVVLALAFVMLQQMLTSSATLSWKTFRWWPLLAALATTILQESSNPWLAKFSLRSIGQDGAYWRLFGIVTATATSNAAIPLPAGIPLRVWLQRRWLGIPYAASSVAAFIETVIGYGLLVLLAGVAALLWAPRILHAVREHASVGMLCAIVVAGLVAGIGLGYVYRRFKPKILAALKLRETFAIRRKPLCAAVIVASAGILLAYLRLIWLGHSLSVTTFDYGIVFAGLVISRLAGVASMMPMGLGARDLSLGYFLVLAGIPPDAAAAWTALDRIVMTLPYVAIGLISIPVLHRLESSTPLTVEKPPDGR